MRTRNKNAYKQDRINRGECPECGAKNDRRHIGGRYCLACLKKNNERPQAFKRHRNNLGLCECGEKLDRPGWYCSKCIIKHREAKHA